MRFILRTKKRVAELMRFSLLMVNVNLKAPTT